MDQVIIAVAGKKGSGKNTVANFITGHYMKQRKVVKDFRINTRGELVLFEQWVHGTTKVVQNFPTTIKNGEFNELNYNWFTPSRQQDGTRTHNLKHYSFADPLKKFCMDVLQLTHEECYGTNQQKNQLTHCNHDEKQLTAREVLQFVGTDVIRSLWGDAWASATYKQIKEDKTKVSIITDARFANEVMMGKENGAKLIKLLRNPHPGDEHPSETALDNFDDSVFDLVLDNREMTIEQQNAALLPHVEQWLKGL